MNPAEVKTVVRRELQRFVGLKHIKGKVESWILGGVMDKGFLPPVALIAPPGTGKTQILQSMMGLARACVGKQGLFFKRGEETGTKTSFVEDVLIPHFHDKDAVIGIDEYHEVKKPVAATIRSLMNPTVARKCHTIRAHGDYEVTFDPYKNSIVIATNKQDLLDQAELSRYQVWNFPYYSDEELEEILQKAMQTVEIRFADNTLRKIAECNRGTARDIVLWSDAIRQAIAIKGKKVLTKDDAKTIIQTMESYPLGLNVNEAKTLILLEKYGELQLQELAARNIVMPKEQRATERYLLQRGLVGVQQLRRLTQAGRAWIADVKKQGFVLPVVR
jgi:Holliday junction resolvasome RuvABC ATP-dependent DNA helicase subunit